MVLREIVVGLAVIVCDGQAHDSRVNSIAGWAPALYQARLLSYDISDMTNNIHTLESSHAHPYHWMVPSELDISSKILLNFVNNTSYFEFIKKIDKIVSLLRNEIETFRNTWFNYYK